MLPSSLWRKTYPECIRKIVKLPASQKRVARDQGRTKNLHYQECTRKAARYQESIKNLHYQECIKNLHYQECIRGMAKYQWCIKRPEYQESTRRVASSQGCTKNLEYQGCIKRVAFFWILQFPNMYWMLITLKTLARCTDPTGAQCLECTRNVCQAVYLECTKSLSTQQILSIWFLNW